MNRSQPTAPDEAEAAIQAIDGLIRSEELKDWAEAARLIGVTRARMTQITSLLLLAPNIQEGIVNLLVVFEGRDTITEHDLRPIALEGEWVDQERTYPELK